MSPPVDFDDDWYISRRIACPDAGYPASEAQFLTIEEYLKSLSDFDQEN
jgi:hypothetical protein